MKQRLLFVLVFLLCALSANATHIVGGEFELQYLTGNNYRLTLNLYFDEINGSPGALDQNITVNIFEKATNKRVMFKVMYLKAKTNVPYTNIECTVGNLQTSKIVYYETITLDPAIFNSPEGYYVTWERCCRNSTIDNIKSPENAAQTFYMEFPAVTQNGNVFRNSSPRLFPPLSDYACINELFYFDFSGSDMDGDSLVYDMVTPINGYTSAAMPAYGVAGYEQVAPYPAPYPLIQWEDTYGENNQVNGTPPIKIDPNSGRLIMRPARTGLFVFGIRVQEFRNKKKIGEVRRDFQVLVLDCPTNDTPKILAREQGKKPLYKESEVLQITPTGKRCIDVFFTDPDLSEFVALRAVPANFSGADYTFSGSTQGIINQGSATDTLKATLCFSDCFDTQGKVFKLDLIVRDDGCSLPRQDTIRVSFIAAPVPDTPPTIALSTPQRIFNVKLGDVINFDVLGADPDEQIVSVNARGIDFALNSQNITFTNMSGPGTVQSNFNWQIDCNALLKSSYKVEFTITSVFCGRNITRTEIVEIRPDNTNDIPKLTSNPSQQVIELSAGERFEMSLLGSDIDLHNLTLSATGQGFDLAAAGMNFTSTGGDGSANGLFTWVAACASEDEAVRRVTFTLKESTCVPSPDQVITIEFRIIDNNNTPTLTSDKAPILYELDLNESFEAILSGNDIDLNPLQLVAVGEGFNLDDYGMTFTASQGNGEAEGKFTLVANCLMADQGVVRVNFILTEEACSPDPVPALTMEFKVRVPLLSDFIPANIFTPNGDGLNDFFEIPNMPSDFCSAQFTGIKVFNRWGKQVYTSNLTNFKWDGSGVNDGVYFYLIDFGSTQYKGSVTIVR